MSLISGLMMTQGELIFTVAFLAAAIALAGLRTLYGSIKDRWRKRRQ